MPLRARLRDERVPVAGEPVNDKMRDAAMRGERGTRLGARGR